LHLDIQMVKTSTYQQQQICSQSSALQKFRATSSTPTVMK